VRENREGVVAPVVDRQGVVQFVVAVFAKLRVGPGEWVPKGEEIKVTLATDPGEGFEEDTQVELIDPRLNAWEIRDEETGRVASGVAFKAMGLKPAASPRGER
jgi:hypothetical protein